jgi:phosphoglycolate phosphatase
MFQNSIYPGIVETLDWFRTEGYALWVVTSKAQPYAAKIVDHFGLHAYFKGVYGAELDGRRSDKADLIRFALAHEALDARDTWMIGDRALDILGGRENQIRTAGVLWGYGLEAEILAAKPDKAIATVDALHLAFCPTQ